MAAFTLQLQAVILEDAQRTEPGLRSPVSISAETRYSGEQATEAADGQ
jgi:hypothetical protein